MKSGYIKLGILALTLLSIGCKDDFDLNASYERLPVVYGMLDPSLDKQYFIIQRTFLGDGNAYEYAAIEDSVLYDEVDAKLIWDNGNQSATLTPEIIDNKDTDGLFFGPGQRVYTVDTDVLDFQNTIDDNYQLSISADEDTIYSETDVLHMTANSLGLPAFNNLNLVLFNGVEGLESTYRLTPLKFNSLKNALRLTVGFRFTYTEFYVGGAFEQKSFESRIRTVRPQNDEGGEEMIINFYGSSFYQRIRDNIPIDNSVVWRVVDHVHLVYSAYGRDLTRYIDMTNASSNIGQESPGYTNINGGSGLGVFSTRTKFNRLMELSATSKLELKSGQYTKDLKF